MTLLNHKKNKIILLSVLNLFFAGLITVNLSGCCAYSFTGASVPPHLKTVAIPIADDRSGSGEPGLRENLTQTLIQKFIDDNTLQVAERTTANALIECTILSLNDAPAIVAAGENIQTRRITLGVKVIVRDLVKKQTLIDKTFSNYGDYSPEDIVQGRSDAIVSAINKISEDILLATVSGW
jgi:hypothetical protein